MRGIRSLRAGREVAAIVADVHSHFVRAQETRVHATLRPDAAVAAPAVQSTIIAAQFSMHWRAKFPESPI